MVFARAIARPGQWLAETGKRSRCRCVAAIAMWIRDEGFHGLQTRCKMEVVRKKIVSRMQLGRLQPACTRLVRRSQVKGRLGPPLSPGRPTGGRTPAISRRPASVSLAGCRTAWKRFLGRSASSPDELFMCKTSAEASSTRTKPAGVMIRTSLAASLVSAVSMR